MPADSSGKSFSADPDRSFSAQIPIDLREGRPIGSPAVSGVGPGEGVQTDLFRPAEQSQRKKQKPDRRSHKLFFLHFIQQIFRFPEDFRGTHEFIADDDASNIDSDRLFRILFSFGKKCGKERLLRVKILLFKLAD